MQTFTKAVEIAQMQLLVKVVDMLVVVHIQAPVRTIRRTVEIPQLQLPAKVVNMPVVLQRQAPMVHKVQQTCELPQMQLSDKVVDVPIVMQRQVPTIQRVQKTVEVPRPSPILDILRKKSMEALQRIDSVEECAVQQSMENMRKKGHEVLHVKQDPTTKDGFNLVDENEKKEPEELEAEIEPLQVPIFQPVQKTVEVPQIQYVDKIVDAPVAAAQQQVPAEVSVGTQTVSRKRKLNMRLSLPKVLTGCRTRSRPRGEGMQVVDEMGVQGPEDGFTRYSKFVRCRSCSSLIRWSASQCERRGSCPGTEVCKVTVEVPQIQFIERVEDLQAVQPRPDATRAVLRAESLTSRS